MYHGKRVSNDAAPKASVSRKAVTVAALLALVLALAVGGTVAFLSADDEPIVNTFTAGKIEGSIDEDFDGDVKSSVVITNSGDAAVYVRVAVVGNWCDKDGNVVELWTPDFTVGSGWTKVGNYYYYNSAVAEGGSTTDLLGSSISGVDPTKPGLHLEVTVLQQTVQAVPADAAEEAWGFVPGGN